MKSNSFGKLSIKKMTIISIMSVLGFLLMFIQTKIPFCPPFIELDAGDLPAIVCTLVYGPVVGIWIEFIKNLLNLVIKGSTGGIGELANFLMGVSYILPLWFVYNKFRSLKGAIIGSVVASFSLIVVACVFNYYILTPAYAAIFGMPIDTIVEITSKINPLIKDYKTYIIFGIAPFNLVKALALGVLNCAFYEVLTVRLDVNR